jgi:hypothetical protein
MRLIHYVLLTGLLVLSPLPAFNTPPRTHAYAQAIVSGFSVNVHNFVQESETITAANWQQQPKIKTVRGIVESVTNGFSKKDFKISKREFEYCEPYEDTLRRIAVDSKGTVRYYEKQGGSDDSSLTFKHYYDEFGQLRFVFIKGGAVNGAKLEHRIYLDEKGNRIWEEHKYVQGPEYFFPKVWPDSQHEDNTATPIQKTEPGKAFSAVSQCDEQKPGPRG